MHTQTNGNLCTKFVVPSRGSIIHVGVSVRVSTEPCDADDSSPMKACSGYLPLMMLMIVFSHFRSVSVTCVTMCSFSQLCTKQWLTVTTSCAIGKPHLQTHAAHRENCAGNSVPGSMFVEIWMFVTPLWYISNPRMVPLVAGGQRVYCDQLPAGC
jgi:hypothetical protein